MPCKNSKSLNIGDRLVYEDSCRGMDRVSYLIVRKVYPDSNVDVERFDINGKTISYGTHQCTCQYKLVPNIIAPEDIRVGMTISILSREPREGMREDKSLYGEHYEVKDVQLPFVYVPSKYGKTMPPMIFDTRELTLIKIQDTPDLQKEIDNLKETIRTMNLQNIALRRNVNKLNEKISQIRSIAG